MTKLPLASTWTDSWLNPTQNKSRNSTRQQVRLILHHPKFCPNTSKYFKALSPIVLETKYLAQIILEALVGRLSLDYQIRSNAFAISVTLLFTKQSCCKAVI